MVDYLHWVLPTRGTTERTEVSMSSEVDSTPEDADAGEPEAGVHVGVTVPASTDQVWQHLISPDGTEALLGEGARLGNKGEPWRAADGSYGVMRSFHPVEQVRVTWHPYEDGPLSMVDIQLRPEGDATRVELFHEGRGIAGDPRGDWQHWDEALGRFSSGVGASQLTQTT
ncbi:SRPBCC domain-containing protein [Pedococcus sp. 5OH_020]|uniref:SRPBCC domain-containing protein n=1 Tax=Pedococcus sp. 5OH_020 TaxID=2989814 RepID=UPI0022E9E776|nr:SRPBCC domain-containing protein [Pedococcus sp. 5OH_020]